MKKIFMVVFTSFLFTNLAVSQDVSEDKAQKRTKDGIRYKKSKKLDFESLLIQGERKRAEIIVVTGDAEDDLGGLLRLRENFLDHQALDFGEVIE